MFIFTVNRFYLSNINSDRINLFRIIRVITECNGIMRDSEGKFTKGNSGRPQGAKSVKNQQWDALGEAIVGRHAENFNNYLDALWANPKDRPLAAELLLKTLDYFKPKLSRVESKNENDNKHSVEFSEDVKNLTSTPAQQANRDTKESE